MCIRPGVRSRSTGFSRLHDFQVFVRVCLCTSWLIFVINIHSCITTDIVKIISFISSIPNSAYQINKIMYLLWHVPYQLYFHEYVINRLIFYLFSFCAVTILNFIHSHSQDGIWSFSSEKKSFLQECYLICKVINRYKHRQYRIILEYVFGAVHFLNLLSKMHIGHGWSSFSDTIGPVACRLLLSAVLNPVLWCCGPISACLHLISNEWNYFDIHLLDSCLLKVVLYKVLWIYGRTS